MTRKFEKKKRPKKEDKQLSSINRITGHIFDDKTIQIISELRNIKVITGLDYPISEGKEAVVFKARSQHGDVAVKIFKYETSSFLKRSMTKYIQGDPRFPSIQMTYRSLVKMWARKEFSNLKACQDAGVSAPTPLKHRDNVVVMQFLGEGGIPYSLLKNLPMDDVDVNVQGLFDKVIDNMKKMWKHGFVHADLNEFNILTDGTNLWFIDMAQSVKKQHPLSMQFFEKDCNNIARFFAKHGVDTSKEEVMASVLKQ